MAEHLALQNAAEDVEDVGCALEELKPMIGELITLFTNAMCAHQILFDSIEGIRMLDARDAITWRDDEGDE